MRRFVPRSLRWKKPSTKTIASWMLPAWATTRCPPPITPPPDRPSQPRAPRSSTHRRASGRCSDFASSHGARIQTSRSSSVVRITGIALGWLGSTVAAGDLMRTRAIQKKAPGFIGAFHLFAFFDDSLAARTVIVFLLDDGRLWRPGAAIAIARRRTPASLSRSEVQWLRNA